MESTKISEAEDKALTLAFEILDKTYTSLEPHQVEQNLNRVEQLLRITRDLERLNP